MINPHCKKQNQPHIDFEPPPIQRWYTRTRVITPVADESVTDTSFGNDTDINKIVERFARTGYMPDGPSIQPVYDDVTNLQGDLTELLAKTKSAREVLDNLEQEQQQAAEQKAKQDAEELEQFRKFKAQQSQQEADGADAPNSDT